jgi:hypothetical protein
MQGSYVPFPRDEVERKTNGDPRRSIAERYPSREHYLGLVAEAAMRLVEERYLLAEDVPGILQAAERHWDYRVEPSAGAQGERSESRSDSAGGGAEAHW